MRSSSIETVERSRKITSRVLQAVAEQKQVQVAEKMGVSESTLSRMLSGDAFRNCIDLLAVLELDVVDADDVRVSKDYLRALRVIAREELLRGGPNP